jgi:phenylpropionate dioxygenase-like ring-hydroxylating dioxygenase large terminal subunit
MKSKMPIEAYCCEDWFSREQQLLFAPLWQFVAPRMLLSSPNAFVRRRIGQLDVVVQNIDGQIVAFENVCAHRQSPIQTESQGVRALVCPYHAWRYGAQGEVLNIPSHDNCYRFSSAERSQLGLRAFKVFEFGQLVFINIHPQPLDFFEQFDGTAVQSLKQASELFDDEVLVSRFECKFNWKLAYENLRDSLHPQFLHGRTVYKQVKFEARIDEAELARAQAYQSSGSDNRTTHLNWLRSFSGGGLNEPMVEMPHYQWHDYVHRYGNDDWYLNWLMYPNLHIASGSAGYSFIIEHHVPVSAGRTDLWVYYVTGRKKRKYPTSSAVLMAHLQGAEKVLAEDIDIMEKVQQNLSSGRTIHTGDFEYTNMAIERWYLDVMEGRHAL